MMISELSIVVPVYNEEDRIDNIFKIIKFCKQHIKKWEIIIVDDGSTDRTRYKILNSDMKGYGKMISYTPNEGKGFAVKTGMELAQYEYILFTDIDLSTPMEELFKLFKYARHYDIVIGSRRMKDSIVEKQGFLRQLAGNIFPLLVQNMLHLKIKDTQCGFKLFNSRAKLLYCCSHQYIKRFAFDVEMLVVARNLKLRVKEVGIKWKNDDNSKLHLIRDSYRMFRDLKTIKGLYKYEI